METGLDDDLKENVSLPDDAFERLPGRGLF
jgi:hypothetical protein